MLLLRSGSCFSRYCGATEVFMQKGRIVGGDGDLGNHPKLSQVSVEALCPIPDSQLRLYPSTVVGLSSA